LLNTGIIKVSSSQKMGDPSFLKLKELFLSMFESGKNKSRLDELQDTLINEAEDLYSLDEAINPGLELRKFLQQIFPSDMGNETAFISRVDSVFKAEGLLSNLVYESTINYLTRRLINTAEFLRRKYESDDYPEEFFIEQLRKYIEDETRIKKSDTEKLLSILKLCLTSKKQRRRSRKKKFIKRNFSLNTNFLCYICGESLTFEEIQIEHEWPKTLGGSSEDFNLRISCCSCNNEKQSYIDGSDFHYEHICLSTDEGDESFAKEFKKNFKIALSAKHNYKCTLCGKSAESVGRLKFIRKNLSDSWHFLNVDTICDICNNIGA
jgi:5-methylcytosine-specific restriction endonuclease McrA